MTLTVAKAIAGSIIDAGYTAVISPVRNLQGVIIDYRVTANTQGTNPVNIAQVQNLAAAHSVNGFVLSVEYK